MSKVINIFVTLLFLVSFFGIQINKHYSNGKLFSVAVYGEPKTCMDAMNSCEMENMHHDQVNRLTENACSCKNQTEFLKVTDFFFSERKMLSGVVMLHHNFNKEYNLTSWLLKQEKPVSFNLFTVDFQPLLGQFRC